MTFYHSLHVKLWDYLAKHPECDKNDALEIFNDVEIRMLGASVCIACEYAVRTSRYANPYHEQVCKTCPLEHVRWKDRCLGGLFQRWLYSHLKFARTGMRKYEKETKRFARKIRDLPVKDGIVVL